MYIKYPRTPHLPWSKGVSDDDFYCVNTSLFEGKEVIVTEKMDGENTSLYNDYLHPRAIDSRPHPSRDWVKALQASLASRIPKHWRICGENIYAQHAVKYEQLESFFYAFSIWTEDNYCLDWDTTLEWLILLELKHPPILYRGRWDEKYIKGLNIDTTLAEGYVVRTAEAFSYATFSSHCAKWVRAGHVQDQEHWMNRSIVPNRLKPTK